MPILAATSKSASSQRVQIGDHVIHLLLGEAGAHGRHHVAATNNSLLHEPVIGDQSAGEIFLLVQALQGGPLERFGVVSAMADRAVELKDVPALGLLGV